MKFYINGKYQKDKDIRGIRGDVYPAVSGINNKYFHFIYFSC